MAIDKNSVIGEAQKFVAKGQYDKAIAEWQKLLKESPHDANIYNTIGDLCLKKNARDEAVESYKRAADILAGDGFTSKAIALYKKVLNIDKSRIDVYLSLGDMNAQKGLVGNALENYKHAADLFTKKNQTAEALGIYRKMADLNPANVAFRIKLADMYAKESMAAEAAGAYLAAADAHVVKNEFRDARHLFEKAMSLDPANREVYFKAGTLFLRESKFSEAVKTLRPAFEGDPANRELADAYLEALAKAGKDDDLEQAMRKILVHVPDRTDLRERYRAVFDRITAPEQVPPPPPEPEEPEILELEIPPAPEAASEEPAESAFEAAIAELPQDALPAEPTEAAGEEHLDPAIAEAITEADVLIKYGLAAKVLDQLEGLTQKFPDSIQVRVKLSEVYRDQGQAARAAIHLLALSDLYAGRGMQARAEQVLQSARELDPANREVLARLGLAPSEPPPPVEAVGPVSEPMETRPPSFEEIAAPEDLSGPLLAPEADTAAPSFEEALPTREPDATEELSFEGLDADLPPHVEETLHEPAAQEPADESGTHAFIDESALSAPQIPPLIAEERETPESTPEPAGHAAPELQHGYELPAGTSKSDLLTEAEFYYQQGLFAEAKRIYTQFLELNPGDKQATQRLADIKREEQDAREFAKLTEAVDGLEEALSAGPAGKELPLSESDENAVRSLMKEITEHEYRAKKPDASGQPALPDAGQEDFGGYTGPAKPVAADDFFDLGAELAAEEKADASRAEEEQTDGYFDLASELKDEFSGAATPAYHSAGEEQSLDEVFEEFKRGVENQCAKEDVDAHYNLGVAYKEMGLLDDAIEEFTLTPADVPKYAQGRYMLGLCYLEKGDYHRAMNELQNALDFSETLGEDEPGRIGMHYDLGLACQGAGDLRGALAEFQKVSAQDPLYQDTATKLKELAQGDDISLDQLKDEIEKEISEKFFIEGERIEREEKNRKSDKVRN